MWDLHQPGTEDLSWAFHSGNPRPSEDQEVQSQQNSSIDFR